MKQIYMPAKTFSETSITELLSPYGLRCFLGLLGSLLLISLFFQYVIGWGVFMIMTRVMLVLLLLQILRILWSKFKEWSENKNG